jgi:hypothetical protein
MRHQDGVTDDEGRDPTYDLPLIQKYLDRVSFLRYIPFCPALVTTTVSLFCLMVFLGHFQQYFSYIVAVRCIGGGNRRTWGKTTDKFIT